MADDVTDERLLAVLRWLWVAEPMADAALQARGRELLLDTIGCAITGLAEPEVAGLFRVGALAEPGAIGFPGTDARLSGAGFAQAFAAAACWHEACEGLASAHGRPGLHAIPAVLGLALARGLPLGTVLDAVVAGYEVGGRLGAVCRVRPGMHVDGTWGSFGAAVAVARLLGATPEQALAACSYVACQMPCSLYWPIPAGSTARNGYPGHGATLGAAAAVAGLAGLGGPAGSIAEMARVALGIDRLPDLAGPGAWLLPSGYLKPFPAVRHVHYAAVAGLAWHAARGAEEVRGIRLRVYQEALTYCSNRAPDRLITAQFSLSFGLAHAMVHGRLDPASYSAAGLTDPAVRGMEALIVTEADPDRTAADRRGCTVWVDGAAGSWTHKVESVPGDPDLPLTRGDVLAKFRAYAGPVIGVGHADAIAARLLDGALDAPLYLGA